MISQERTGKEEMSVLQIRGNGASDRFGNGLHQSPWAGHRDCYTGVSAVLEAAKDTWFLVGGAAESVTENPGN